MASAMKKILIQGVNKATWVTSNTDALTLEPGSNKFLVFFKVAAWVAGTFTPVIEHSPDNINWFVLATFAAKGANGSELIDITDDKILPYVRVAQAVAAGPGNATITVEILHDKSK